MEKMDLVRFRKWFDGYCHSFGSANDADNRNYSLKEIHTHQVSANMKLLTAGLQLGGNDLLLAESIALFHDVGRFRQYRQFGTFKDSSSLNHAVLGARVLAEEQVLAALPPGEQRLILKMVALHNIFRMPDYLDQRELLFLSLIRDADKLDIWRVFIEYYSLPPGERASAVGLGFPDEPYCSRAVLDSLGKGEMVNLSILKTLNDFKLLQISWVFDLNFAVSRYLVNERRYIDQIAATLPDTPEVISAVDRVQEYLHDGNYVEEEVKGMKCDVQP